MSYTKLFSSIVTSTIWTEDANTCKVWVTMLAIADKHGEVHASIPGLAQIAGMPLGVVEAAIGKFLSPDKYSRTPDDEGRRIEAIDGGWLLLNHAKYRAMASKDEEKSASAKRQAAFRERQRRNGKVTDSNAPVTPSNDAVTVKRDIAEAEAEAEAVKGTKLNTKASTRTPLTPQGGGWVSDALEIIWSASPKLGRERSSRAQLTTALKKLPAKDRPAEDELTDALAAWMRSESWTRDGGAFVPGIHRWVNGRQWENVPAAAGSTHGRNHAGIEEDIPF